MQELERKVQEYERNAQESKMKELEALRLLEDSKNVTVSDERPLHRTRGPEGPSLRYYSLPSPMSDDSLARMFLWQLLVSSVLICIRSSPQFVSPFEH
jgi:hypothetical protein